MRLCSCSRCWETDGVGSVILYGSLAFFRGLLLVKAIDINFPNFKSLKKFTIALLVLVAKKLAQQISSQVFFVFNFCCKAHLLVYSALPTSVSSTASYKVVNVFARSFIRDKIRRHIWSGHVALRHSRFENTLHLISSKALRESGRYDA